MFHDIPQAIRDRMAYLERLDARDRTDGTPRMERLRQVPPTTGRLIALLAASIPPGMMIEVGASAGYSALWLALACREIGRSLTTFELLPAKAALARETFAAAGVEDVMELVEGDALDQLPSMSDIAFCFLDAEKEVYAQCYDLVVPRLVTGGLLVADNATSHAEDLKPMLDRALSDPHVDAMVLEVNKGELICRKRG
jgi:caffeoyl-CoA O-methyltransferase